MTVHEAKQQLLFQLYSIYDNSESQQIAELVMEHITGWKRIDQALHKMVPLLPEQKDMVQQLTHELLQNKPLQYVLRESWFAGMKLYVDERVLIPRPETEELVDWILKDIQRTQNNKGPRILDIGTGSGCIALALKKKLPFCEVHACDISEGALTVARQNAATHHLNIQFHLMDILKKEEYTDLPVFDCIVSNPPYIPVSDTHRMQPNVLEHEPHLALFVPNDDAIIFYKAIAGFAKKYLRDTGVIYAEIQEAASGAIRQVFSEAGFSKTEIRKDMQGKNRMVKAMFC